MRFRKLAKLFLINRSDLSLRLSVNEFIDPWVAKTADFTKTSPKRSFSMTETSILGLFSRKPDTGVNTAKESCFLLKRCLQVSAFFSKILRTVCAGLPV